MGLFSSKQKTDPAYTASKKSANQVMDLISKQTLPALPGPAAATLDVPAALPAYLGGGAAITYPAGAMPNQLSMIANQLTAGGYGAPDQSMYRAQTVAPYVPPPPTPIPAAAAAPASPAAPSPPAAPVVKKPLGFTAQQYVPSVNSQNQGIQQRGMFQTFNDLARFLAANRR